MKDMIINKIKAMGAGAGTRWIAISAAAMAGDADAKAACSELLGKDIENMADLYAVQSAAHDAMSAQEQHEDYCRAMQDLHALRDVSRDAKPYLGNKLSSLRRSKGMTQKDLSVLAGVTLVTLQKLENGTNSLLRARTETCLALAKALGITVEQLITQDHTAEE